MYLISSIVYLTSYILNRLSISFLFWNQRLSTLYFMTADQGCGYITRQSMQPWVLFMCWCMPPLYYHFLLLSVHYLCNLIQAISGLLLHVVMICKGEPPSGSFLRSMGKLGLDWIGYYFIIFSVSYLIHIYIHTRLYVSK